MRLLSATDFAPSRYPVGLADAEVQVWYFPPTRTTTSRSGGDPRLPRLLAAYTGCDAADLRFDRGAHGKPSLRSPATLQFNLSHSGGALLVAISRDQPLGVDLESLARQRPGLELARRFFDGEEADALARLGAPRQHAAFLRLWSCKEAVVKALGQGLSFGLARLRFALDSQGWPIALNVIHASAGTPQEWQIIQLAPGVDAVGAVAWRGPERTLRAFAVVDG